MRISDWSSDVCSSDLLTRPPGIPSLVEGFLNLAGFVIPVLRIDRLFGEPDIAFDPYLCVIVLKNASSPLSLLVEGVDTVIRLQADEDRKRPCLNPSTQCAPRMTSSA